MRSLDVSNKESQVDAEGYQLEVNEVAELLGVTRTRVSQLTSSGQLSFERRRVGTRNRLFYKRSEVLAHQRGFYGRQHAPNAPLVGFDNVNDSDFLSAAERIGASAHHRSHDSHRQTESSLTQTFHRLGDNHDLNRRQLGQIMEAVSAVGAYRLRAAHKPHVSAAGQRESESVTCLIGSLIEDVARLAQKLEEQQNLILSLHDESRSLKRDLFQIRQAQLQSISSNMSQGPRLSFSKTPLQLEGLESGCAQAVGPESDLTPARRKISIKGRQSRSAAKRSFIKR